MFVTLTTHHRLAVKKRSRGEEVLPKDFSEDVGPQLPEPPMIVPNLVTTISTNDGVQEEVLPLPSVVRRTRYTQHILLLCFSLHCVGQLL